MYILKYQDIEIAITDEEWMELYRWYMRGFRPLREFEEFADRIFEKVKPPTTRARFRVWLAEAFSRGMFEYRPEVAMVRVQYAVLYYTNEVTHRTPNPFMEARAWVVCPREDAPKYRAIVEREAWFIPMLFGSVHDAWAKGSVSEVEGSPSEEIVAVRGGFEERPVEERPMDLQRGVAFYRIYYDEARDTWENPKAFFGEEEIKEFEKILFPCILEYEGFKSEEEFKEEVVRLHKKACECLERGDLEEALIYIETITMWMAECGVLYAPVRWR